MEDEIDKYFLKKFQFQQLEIQSFSCENPFGNSSWKVPELQNLKIHLNCTKGFLSHMEAERWHVHTSYTNRAGAVFQKVKSEVCPELLTQFSWLAATLNPYYEGNCRKSMIGDDRFIHNTLCHWNFGHDDTGDIMEWCNVNAILQWKGNHVNLVTADGSIDCAGNPGEQEKHLAKLHWCETISALLLLSPGGSYVLKMFTFFEHSAVSLLYLLRLSFEDLNVFKPCTSKEGNSEVYVIALRYTQTQEMQKLLSIIQAQVYERKVDISLNALFSLSEIPKGFLRDIINCATLFKDHQEEAIMRNLTLYNVPLQEKKLAATRKNVAQRYMQKYGLRSIAVTKQILGPENLRESSLWNFQPYYEKNLDSSPPTVTPELCTKLQSELKEIDFFLEKVKSLKWVNRAKQDWKNKTCYTYGKSYDIIRHTKFCHAYIFRVFKFLGELSLNLKSKSFFETLKETEQSFLINSFLDVSPMICTGGNFELRRPVLSRFSVASLWIISLLFSQVEFHSESDPLIRFVGYHEEAVILNWMRQLDRKLLNFVELPSLFQNSFYNLVTRYNSKLLLEFSIEILNTMLLL
ncbi:cap-specific mRNA (nucleoside-2'-O-)-methyltransferase 2-like isoform X2 [Daphnia carinata]|uniref:cap-specific mRNA (nucleoside-2'-O-)-methyltransferase 2-like isoform X2 n=1 Tax=Daphnia carinata TaxID=120202 RepID=UPI002868A819|nr:cap-specific mRNA (nucleoside-2'-O-)-methyltransferase 2-like isoform X2 [Daphnia carinata]